MQPSQAFNEIPYSKLRRTEGYGQQAQVCFFAAVLVVLLGHFLLPAWSTMQQAFWAMALSGICFLLIRYLKFRVKPLESLGSDPQLQACDGERLRRPTSKSKLIAWTRSGDVVELVFDSGSWMLVRADVNDRQWRDVQRLLVWRKRVPSRAVL
jgi:hypothetical protein